MIDPLATDKYFSEKLEEKETLARTTSVEGETSMIKDYMDTLMEVLEELRSSEIPYSAKERETRTLAVNHYQEEINTWQIVMLMTEDVLLTTSNHFCPPEVSSTISRIPSHRWWAMSHKQLVTLRLSWDYNFRRTVLALIWLESVYARCCRIDNKLEEYVPPGFRPATAALLSEGLGGSPCPLTRRTLVTSLEFDAPAREQAFIHPADEDTERTLYKVILEHIRCGNVKAAKDLCEQKRHLIAAALMKETVERLQHIPGTHDCIVPEVELQPEITKRLHLEETGSTRTNTHHFSVAASLLELASEDASCGGAAQCATFGALGGLKEPMMKLYQQQQDMTLRDSLWISMKGSIEHMIHCVVQPSLKSHVDYNEEDANTVLQLTKPQFDSLAEASRQALQECGGSNCFLELQGLLLQLFGESSCCGVGNLTLVFECLSTKVVEVAPRLASHLSLLLWRCRNQLLTDLLTTSSHTYLSSLLDNILTRYAQILHQSDPSNTSLLLTTIPFLSSKMEQKGIDLSSIYIVSLIVSLDSEESDDCVQKTVNRLNSLGMDTAAVLRSASQVMSGNPLETVEEWFPGSVRKGAKVGTALDHRIECIKVMTYLPELSEEALRLFNDFCRDVILRVQELSCRTRYCLSSSEVAEADAVSYEISQLMVAFGVVFSRAYGAVDEQFQRRLLTQKQSTLAFVKLVTERAEASHWELIQASLSSLSLWKHAVSQKPLNNPPAAKLSPQISGTVQATWLQCLEEGQQQRFEKALAIWADTEKKARTTMKRQALRVISREHEACLVDMTSVANELDPLPLAEARYWFQEREQSLLQLRAAVIPDIVEGILEALALHADHLSVEDRLKECTDSEKIFDALVADEVSEWQSLQSCFQDALQASRIVAYAARVDAFRSDINAQASDKDQ
eukprot:TRINITY_DN20236_c0_g1_i1.p1 TRINITY_DN20236_c0_g1~~TRINITY_DN20236_c0_g1_i1.p1  ORF type:complete len:909 (+),score=160.39 TRINITY_DN20236_c0_g1_i1:68-2794(+)